MVREQETTHILNSAAFMGAIVLLLMSGIQLYSAIATAVAAGQPWYTGVTEGGVTAVVQAVFGIAFMVWRAVKPSSPKLRVRRKKAA